jgi:hypothetical protein
MVGGEDVLFRPVLHKVLAPERLLDGSVDLAFVMLLNRGATSAARWSGWTRVRHVWAARW